MDFIPNTDADRELMLSDIKVDKLSDLSEDIPLSLLIGKLRIPAGLSEMEVKELMEKISRENKVNFSYFLGAGAYKHFIPSVVNHIVSRSEFYTAYTPYQPEISQGLLQAIYEYQTMICELTGMDATNASMYDGASALAESCIMACNITKRKEILFSSALHPHYRQVVETYCAAHDFSFIEVGFEEGETSLDKIRESLSENTAAVIIQSPNFFGCIEKLKEIAALVHSYGALLNVCVNEGSSLGILKSPGALGVDIAVCEGQAFGNSVSFGGPFLGVIATKERYVRYLPGRIVGATVDKDGQRGYILNLQAREQHIRREKASSNICSNQALCALSAAVYLSAMGKSLRKVGELCLQKAHYLAFELNKKGFPLRFDRPFYNEFAVKVPDSHRLNEELLREGIIGGLELGKYYPELADCILFCVTEMNTREEIDKLVRIMKKFADLG